MKKLNLLRAAFLALLLGLGAVSDSYGQENSGSQEQTNKKTNLTCTVAEFAEKYHTLKKGEDVSVTLTDVSDENIVQVREVIIGMMDYKIDLVLQSKNKGLTKIGERVFKYFESLTSITIPNSVTEIGEEAFYHCSSLTSITIPNSVTKIGKGAFSHCSSLTSITIPNSVTKIGDVAF